MLLLLMVLLVVGVVWWVLLLLAREAWRRAVPPLLLLVLWVGWWGWVRLLLEAAALPAGWPCVRTWQVAVAAAAASHAVLPDTSSSRSGRCSCRIRASSSS